MNIRPYNRKTLEVINNCLVDKKSNNVYGYLRDISKLFDFVKNDYGENVLEKRISLMNLGKWVALSLKEFESLFIDIVILSISKFIK